MATTPSSVKDSSFAGHTANAVLLTGGVIDPGQAMTRHFRSHAAGGVVSVRGDAAAGGRSSRVLAERCSKPEISMYIWSVS